MRAVWCMILYFFGARAEITQTSSLVLKEDENATLKCSQNDNHSYMYWYMQQPGKGLQSIYYSYRTSQIFKGDVHTGYEAKRLSQEVFHLDIVSVKKNHSAVYFCASMADNSGTSSKYCANSPLSFGQGTRLTVVGKNDEIIPPAVAIFSPSKQEIQQKNKATLVCLASGFYPDNLNLVWKVNGVKRTEGVGTDETSTSNGSTYALTSRLRISAQEWFNPLNRFECIANFFKNKTLESIHKFIYGDTGCDIFRENYQRTATAGKFVYMMLIFKSALYGIFVLGMMLWYKKVY
ncbi:M1-specific T cell receptor beta chain-like [Coturnix japonica]|uniref:M1-specific T cell receptor beta chain-like n=1 Tax=Coturnix japonica TaxID=93934 RepID=UPI0013A5C6DA|nr:M1-specific T cell receptor beta chain-like [Coturnix japonica]